MKNSVGANEDVVAYHGDGAIEINIARYCKKCNAPLTLEEMHYYDRGDGTATCNTCEERWTEEVALWRIGERESIPDR